MSVVLLNQNIVNCTTPKIKHQDNLIDHQSNTNMFWVYNQYNSNVDFNGGECALGAVKTRPI